MYPETSAYRVGRSSNRGPKAAGNIVDGRLSTRASFAARALAVRVPRRAAVAGGSGRSSEQHRLLARLNALGKDVAMGRRTVDTNASRGCGSCKVGCMCCKVRFHGKLMRCNRGSHRALDRRSSPHPEPGNHPAG